MPVDRATAETILDELLDAHSVYQHAYDGELKDAQHKYKEARAAVLAAMTTPEGSVTIPKEAWDFLNGRGELDGVSFGERHPTRSGAFWWRSYISALAAAPEVSR